MPSPARIASQLQQEIRQRVPFASIQDEAFIGILHTADVLRRRTSKVLEPFGITPQQYNVLRILRGAGSAGLPTLEIAERMIEQTPGITRMIDRLEAKKLVQRERGLDDRRQVLCRITGGGLDLLTKADAPLKGHAASAMGETVESELTVLIRLLDAIRAAPQE